MKYKIILFIIFTYIFFSCQHIPTSKRGEVVPQEEMEIIYNEIKTPYKYGIVLKHPDSTKMVDSPTIFRKDNKWYMTYIVFDGKGYETWLAESNDLLEWKTLGKILSFTKNTWDENQKAGYVSLIDIEWEGSYEPEQFKGKYWMSYLGGSTLGYEAGTLNVGLAYTDSITKVKEWKRYKVPILSPKDSDAKWYDNSTIYKSLIIRDYDENTEYPFVMFYNAKGDTARYESIAMAVSNDIIFWKRFGNKPLITKGIGICGDAQIAKIDNIYVMFYFGAFWKPEINNASEKFACSYDLVHWTEWQGEDLVESSEDYDKKYAHKPWVVKWNGTVYHFYTAVGNKGRVIALSTSRKLKK